MTAHLPPIVERRSVPRYPVKERASAITSDGVSRACIVMDFSQRGARLGLGVPYPLPLRFEIVFPTGQRVKANLVWQRELVAGVAFDLPLSILERIAVWKWLRRSKSEAAAEIVG